MTDLFSRLPAPEENRYDAGDIEILRGLDAVRRRPGMYVGGTDEDALHHLVAELLDNAVDEAVAGHATMVSASMAADGSVTVRDNGRGIPVAEHPDCPGKSALEVILTTLHSGGKFSGRSYATAGGLHGVGLSVVNALSDRLHVEVTREGKTWRQAYSRGLPLSAPVCTGRGRRRGTTVSFHPDPDIFGTAVLSPARILGMLRTRAFLCRTLEARWSCPADMATDTVPAEGCFRFPGGLQDFLALELGGDAPLVPPFSGRVDLPGDGGALEWAIAWVPGRDGRLVSFCNTIPTPLGGHHESGFRNGLVRALRDHGGFAGQRRAPAITAGDVTGEAVAAISLSIPEPRFHGQTKERLVVPGVQRTIETVIRDHFGHWLAAAPREATLLLDRITEESEARLRRRRDRENARRTTTRRLRLPGKLTDCNCSRAGGAEIFIVEGDSAGGSAKQARRRETQAILPLKGKILNVASATGERQAANQEIGNLVLALGCGTGGDYRPDALRYEKVIIMTDADVDGAHIASLLMTFFCLEMPELVRAGHLFLAQPPLYRLGYRGKVVYARDDQDRDRLLATVFGSAPGVGISRFKGLGEMSSVQLRDTTMDPDKRTLVQVTLPDDATEITSLVARLMGRQPGTRLALVQDSTRHPGELDI